MQTRWATILNPLLKNPVNGVSILRDIELVPGDNVINHLLARQMQGWFLVDITGAAVIYRNAPMNAVTLTLNSDATVTVNIGVF